jgi:hypothetical protein
MLSDLIANAQQLSANLPPDDWKPETSRPLLARQPNGIVGLVSRVALWDEESARLICRPWPSTVPYPIGVLPQVSLCASPS